MKLSRWLVIGMLTSSVLAVLAAAGWWWVTWPEQDMREFLSLVENDRFEEANEFMVNSDSWVRSPGGEIRFHVIEGFYSVSCGSARWRDEFRNAERLRTWTDLCAGRVRLRLSPSGYLDRAGPSCVQLVFENHRVSSESVEISDQEYGQWMGRIEAQKP